MSEWAAKRFWTSAGVEEGPEGFSVMLDGRPVKTPAKAPLCVPTPALAEAVAAEWNAVAEKIDPNVMPFTRSANAAIDKVATQFDAVVEMLAAYAGSDLLCYRAEAPAELVALQNKGWDPLLDWADEEFGARLITTAGVMPVEQSNAAVRALTAPLQAATPFEMAALHDLISLSGSLVLAHAVTRGRLSPEEAWTLSRLDEDWQSTQWGEDAEAAQAAAVKRSAFLHAARVHELSTLG